jgi:MOSC domain-containing protein YiiM
MLFAPRGTPSNLAASARNVTITGVNRGLLEPGVQLDIGEVGVELTAYAMPCWNTAPASIDGRSARISQKTHPGRSRVYARVLREGVVRVGDTVVVR